MDVYEAIETRMTIRDFEDRMVDPDLVRKLISAGFKAPTNNHLRHWHFVLLPDKTQRKAILDKVIEPVGKKGAVGIVKSWGLTEVSQREMYIEAIPRQYDMLYGAGCLILPCFCQQQPLLKPKDLSALNPFASIWCCIENILVAAASEGIYGVTRIPFETERKILKQILSIPPEFEIPCYIALGYPAENALRTRQIEIDLDLRIHLNRW